MESTLSAVLEPHGRFILDWTTDVPTSPIPDAPSLQSPSQQLFVQHLADPWKAILSQALSEPPQGISPSTAYILLLGTAFLKAFSGCPEAEFARSRTQVPLVNEHASTLLAESPWMSGAEHLSREWLDAAWAAMQAALASLLEGWSGTVTEWLASGTRQWTTAGRICFHLVENRKGDTPFAFLATYLPESDLSGSAPGRLPRHLPLKTALQEYAANHSKLLALLSVVHRAADSSSFMRGLLDSGELFQPIGLSAKEAYTFLSEIPLYEKSGILCRMPDWWKKRAHVPTVQIRIGQNPVSRLGLNAMLDFHAKISVDGEPLTEQEIRALLLEAEGLALIKGRWVEIRHDQLKKTLEAYKHAEKLMRRNGITFAEALRFQLEHETKSNPDMPDHGVAEESEAGTFLTEVSHGTWLQDMLAHLRNPENLTPMETGSDFHARLRPYQQTGLNWLGTLQQLGLGACLADDMGLGKTVQVLALLNGLQSRSLENSTHFSALLVLPASLIGNWTAELERFTPSLTYTVLHASMGSRDSLCANPTLSITTYGMLSRMPALCEQDWDMLILDEAQSIKNPGTRQTRAAKAVPARFRLALTGTPLENRLGDLWSLFDFLNKGLLGSPKEFTAFSDRLSTHPSGYAPLKRMISPFVLRRMKTDKAIISDLPDKVEMKTYALLSERQAVLYKEVLEDIRRAINGAVSGIERKGLVLVAMMRFKQICNHPDHYLGQPTFRPGDSGKFERLREICEVIRDKRERVLVFTQFKEMTEPLRLYLAEIFGHDGQVLHGGVPVAKRRELVERFQGHEWVPFMVLSIKAGGVGLNLTAANHVIHFDRWWNPAVENQATDRAFRIGQQKNVMVHKFVTTGTLEEKIDRMIEDKRKLAQDIVPDMQEAWITELDNRQLLELFRLDETH